MSDIVFNAKYAPGIPTYGIPGQDGEKGDNGRSLFYTSYDIENEKDKILRYIKENKIVDSNIEYKYSYGDSFVQNNGEVYQYISQDNLKHIGQFNFNNIDIFEKGNDDTDTFIYNKEQISLHLTDNGSNITDSGFIFNINSNENNFIKLQNGDASIVITYDDNVNGFKFSSDKPIFFDNLYAVNNDKDSENTQESDVDGYQPVVTSFDIIKFDENGKITNEDLAKDLSANSTNYFFEFLYSVEEKDANDNIITTDYKKIANNTSFGKTIQEILDASASIIDLIITSKQYFISKCVDLTDKIITGNSE